MKNKKIAVLGGGSWATALIKLLSESNPDEISRLGNLLTDLMDVRNTIEKTLESYGLEKLDIQEKPINLFYSYSHNDEELRDELEKHLSILRRQNIINKWHDHSRDETLRVFDSDSDNNSFEFGSYGDIDDFVIEQFGSTVVVSSTEKINLDFYPATGGIRKLQVK